MAYVITADCNNCAACEPECPNDAITEGTEFFVIDPNLCTECVGFHDEPQCASVCPVDCCLPDLNHKEDEATLLNRAKSLHPEEQIPDGFPSHFKK